MNTSKKEKQESGKIGRRDFIRTSAMVCCMANLPFASSALSKDDSTKKKEPGVNPLELATYCGLYCGACDIYQKRIGNAGKELKKVLDAYDFGEIATQVPGMENYESFEQVLNVLINFFGQCPNCQKGGGNPQCQIRTCCKEKGYKTCAECPSIPCEKLKPMVDGYPQLKEMLEEIKTTGLENWCQVQQEKVNQGYRYSDTLGKK